MANFITTVQERHDWGWNGGSGVKFVLVALPEGPGLGPTPALDILHLLGMPALGSSVLFWPLREPELICIHTTRERHTHICITKKKIDIFLKIGPAPLPPLLW